MAALRVALGPMLVFDNRTSRKLNWLHLFKIFFITTMKATDQPGDAYTRRKLDNKTTTSNYPFCPILLISSFTRLLNGASLPDNLRNLR
jgi:hypothetical protein